MCVPGCQEALRAAALSRRGLFRGAAGLAVGALAAETAWPETAWAETARTETVAQAPVAPAAPVAARGVVPAQRRLRAIDLTHTMSPEFPSFFGVPGIEMQRQFDLKRDGFNLNWWRLNEHAGTHFDAPLHFSATGAPVERIDAENLVVPLAVVDVRSRAGQNADYLLSRQDLLDWEKRHRRLPDGACVAMLSGWGQYVTDAAKYTGAADGVFHFPGIAPEAAEWLLAERKISGLAVDTLSLDHGPSKDFRTHTVWLGAGHWGLENVANLDRAPAAGATLVVGVAKVKDATGGPARLFALT